jgi:hypothetical protein
MATHLNALGSDEVGTILECRYEHLKRGTAFVPPVEIDQAVSLYGRYHGDLRKYLQLLDEATDLELGVRGNQPLSAHEIGAFMAPCLRDRLTRGPNGFEIGMLRRLLDGCGSEDKLSVDHIASRAGLQGPAAYELLCRLVRGGVLRPVDALGPYAACHPTGDASIAFGLPL